ncbi:MAG: hypothetical protein Q8O56_14135 [Solirubrobacteraceae bacterium]|nr:hypothetical protein [Solirubrobacteraceae bacterium]
MTTFTTPDAARLLAQLDERTRSAWSSYRDALAGLDGPAYDAAEAAQWDGLQAALGEIEIARAALTAPVDA